MSIPRTVSRREFLHASRNAALGVGAGLVFPNLFLNKTRAATGENPSDAIRIGFIGTGNQGRGHLRSLAKRAVAVCDADQTHLADALKLVERSNGRPCAGYSDYRKLLEDKSVDAVLIATPDHWHTLPVIHACQAGKDVYCEKPLTLTVAEGQAIVKAARQTKRIVQTGSQQRSDSKFRLACELVRSGRIGKVKTVKVGLPGVNFAGPPVPDSAPPPELDYGLWLGPALWRPYNKLRVHYYFRFFWDYSGGQMTNWGAHHVDIAQWGLGMDDSGPVSIEAEARYHPQDWYEVPQWTKITYQYANGVTMLCGQDYQQGTTFEGANGSIYVNRGTLESDPEEIITEPIKKNDVHLYASSNHHRNWFDCIKSRKPPICDAAIGHRSATVCHLGNIAIRVGRKIHWNPRTEQIVGDNDAAQMLSRPHRAPWELPKI